jgi:hypothetical protein
MVSADRCTFMIDSLQHLNCHSNFIPMIALFGRQIWAGQQGRSDWRLGADPSRQWGGCNG